MPVVLGIITALLLTGCAGSPIGDALAGPEVLAQRDDAYCRSLGASSGNPDYINCRLTVSQQRNESHANRIAAAQAAVATSAALTAPRQVTPVQPMQSILPTQCRSIHVGMGQVQTTCQ